MSADPILDRLKALHPKAIDLSLDRVRRLMADLGDPQECLPPTIHVAGTNGKGSTVAALRAILEAAGRRVHVYTSPHLVWFNERIRLAGRLIDDEALDAVLREVERVNASRPITFFEVTTAAAFLAFARAPADVALIEVGMGGRLDATNLISRPVATVITPVAHDHMQYLGTTLAEIAREKAGILKPGVPAVIGPQPDEAAAASAARATDVGAPLVRHGVEWHVDPESQGFVYRGAARLVLPPPLLPGRHQIFNTGAAIAALEQAPGLLPDHKTIAAGLSRIEWPARLQRLARGRLVERLPAQTALYIDGGHNTAAAVALADWSAEGSRPLDVIFGMLSTKDPVSFLKALAPHVRAIRTVGIPEEPLASPAESLADASRTAGIGDAAPADNIEAALDAVGALSPPPARVLICGSLYLAGAVLRANS